MHFHWHGGAITRATLADGAYRNIRNVRRFLAIGCGPDFKSERDFMACISNGTRRSMGDVADESLSNRLMPTILMLLLYPPPKTIAIKHANSPITNKTADVQAARRQHQLPASFSNALETRVVIVGVVAVARLLARSTAYDAAQPAIRRTRRANRIGVVVAARMLRQQSRTVAEQHAVLAEREGAACLDEA